MEEDSNHAIYFLHSSNSWETDEKLSSILPFSNIVRTSPYCDQETVSPIGDANIRNDEQQIQCNVCGKSFDIDGSLKLDKARFKCKLCFQVCLQKCFLGRLNNSEQRNAEKVREIGDALNASSNKLNTSEDTCQELVCEEDEHVSNAHTEEGTKKHCVNVNVVGKDIHKNGNFSTCVRKPLNHQEDNKNDYLRSTDENKCNICKRIFQKKSGLTRHKCMICTVCSKSFDHKGHLTAHMRTHTGERPFECSTCSRAFSAKNNLTKHMIVHTSEKPYECSICSKGFKRKHKLEDHVRIHTVEKLFKCTICCKECRQKNHLDDHMKCHTYERCFKCPTCFTEFKFKRGLERHMKVQHTVEKTYI